MKKLNYKTGNGNQKERKRTIKHGNSGGNKRKKKTVSFLFKAIKRQKKTK